MKIGELARRTGVAVATIRHYEKKGLLPAASRSKNGYRRFGGEAIRRIVFIRQCRALHIPLEEIRHLLKYLDDPNLECREVLELIGSHLSRIRSEIKQLVWLERQLTRLHSGCRSGTCAAACGILQDLKSERYTAALRHS